MRKYLTPADREVQRNLFGYADTFETVCRALQISRRELDVDQLADQLQREVPKFLHTRHHAVLVKYVATGGGGSSGTYYVPYQNGLLQLADNVYGGSDETWTVTVSQQVTGIVHACAGGGSGGLGITNGISGPPGEDLRGGGGGGGGSVSQGTSFTLVPQHTYSIQTGTGDHLGGPGGTTFMQDATTTTDIIRLGGGTSASGTTAGVGGTGVTGSSLLSGGAGGQGAKFDPTIGGGTGAWVLTSTAGANQTPGCGGGGGGGCGDNTMGVLPQTQSGSVGGNGTAAGGANGRPASAASGEGGSYNAGFTTVGTAPNTSSSGGGGGGYTFTGVSGQWGGGGGGGCGADGGTTQSVTGGRGGHGLTVLTF